MAVIPPEIAQECMKYFNTIMNGSDLGPIKQSFSSSVTFKTPEFAEWLIDNKYLENTTTIRISFGIYTEAAAEELHIPELAGRLTAFVWPINNGEEKPPFNLGQTKP
jgi:hypothetical protein